MAIAYVNHDDYEASGVTSVANNTALNTTTGNFIAVIISTYDGGSGDCVVTGVTDTASNTYIKALGEYRSGTAEERIEIWYAENITGNANNITTAALTRRTQLAFISVAEFSGVKLSGALDDTASNVNTPTTTHTSGNMTASAAEGLIIGVYGGVNDTNMTVGGSFTTLTTDLTSNYFLGEYRIVSSSGTYVADLTTSGSTGSITGGAIFLPAETGTNMQINIGDAWKEIAGAQINIGDTWKVIEGMQINIGDDWKTIF